MSGARPLNSFTGVDGLAEARVQRLCTDLLAASPSGSYWTALDERWRQRVKIKDVRQSGPY